MSILSPSAQPAASGANHNDATSVDEIALEFVDQVYRDVSGGWLSTFAVDRTTGDRHVDWSPVEEREILTAVALDRSVTCDVWIGAATRVANLGARRGGVGDCAELPALFADIDIAGPNHKVTDSLPADLDAAYTLIAAFPLPPTLIVATGGGLQPWWLLAEPQPVNAVTLTLLAAWGATWAQIAARNDLRVDNVFNADRILRLPGTVNRKNEPTLVTITHAEWDRRYGLDDIDAHLIEPPTPPTSTPRRSTPYIGVERPGDTFDARHTGGEVLGWLGFTHARTDSNGDEHWVRPGKDAREGHSATVYAEDGHVTVWSDTVAAQYPALDVRRPYDPYGLWVATQHAGDFSAASAELRRRGYGGDRDVDLGSLVAGPVAATSLAVDESIQHGWEASDLTTVVGVDYDPPRPTVLARTDGQALFYPGRLNTLIGESGCGKSWAAQLAVVQELAAGRHVIYVDLEDHAASLAGRLVHDLGVAPNIVLDYFTYIQPDLAYGTDASTYLEQLIHERNTTLIVIDSVGEAMALQGQKQNDDDEVARWNRMLPRRLASLGPALALIDHVPKAKDAPAGYAIGSQRKKAAIDGAGYRVEQVKAFGRGRHGIAKLTCTKDRHGTYPTGFSVGELHLDATGETSSLRLKAPVGASGAPFRPTVLMERVSMYLEGRPAQSQNSIVKSVTGNDKHIGIAINVLVDEGFVGRHEKGNAFFHWSEKPYRQVEDLIADPSETTTMSEEERPDEGF